MITQEMDQFPYLSLKLEIPHANAKATEAPEKRHFSILEEVHFQLSTDSPESCVS